jgi:NAD(P)-dependent dehydrogenase (short-subunit alcohol dehydrogenase family)
MDLGLAGATAVIQGGTQVEAALAEVGERFGSLDILVNATGPGAGSDFEQSPRTCRCTWPPTRSS